MADTKISALTAATTPLAGTEVLPIVQSGATVKVAVSDLTSGRAISATQLTLTAGNLIVPSGNGIDFSATPGAGTSELLSDYEEGTWTPSVASTSGSITTITGATGQYVKVGRLVQLTGYFVIANNGTGAGLLNLTGLPFARNSIFYVGSGREMLATGNGLFVYFDVLTTTLYIQKYDGTYPGGTGYGIAFSISYQV